MNIATLKQTVKRLLQRAAFYLPSPLPLGMTEFGIWSQSIIDAYGFPNNDSIRFALASMVLGLGPTVAYRSKRYFGLCVKAGAAKQIAGAIFVEIKEKQKAQQAADQAALTQKTEATAATALFNGA